ncbi:MAG: Gfo/Idh/MocA family oxidoreductase [Acidobacteriota bacterium]|jgi:predicted dehydrogenase
MWVLTDQWQSGYPEYHRHTGQVEIAVRVWLRLHEIEDLYFIPQRSPRTVWDYVRTHGVQQTWRKVRSRLAEQGRNRKFVAFGAGEVLESDPESAFSPGDAVLFLAPCHPAAVDRVCLHESLVRLSSTAPGRAPNAGMVMEGGLADEDDLPCVDVAGWSELSGRDLPPVEPFFDKLGPRIVGEDLRRVLVARPCARSSVDSPTRSDAPGGHRGARPTAVLFGFGHYARNVVVPRISRHVDLQCVHEIDPTLLVPGRVAAPRLRTSLLPRAGESYDVYLVCGYHHTHTPVAVAALERGASAIVEKPPATTLEQLELLLQAMSSGSGRVFVAYQRRYSRFNDFIHADLQVRQGDAIHCHALAYEVPLPARHWYRWPASGTRMLSNGCHWIDYFLFLNGFSSPTRIDAGTRSNGDAMLSMDLENGASLTLNVTEHGSPRLGVRDHIELRAGARTVTIDDQRAYRAESEQRLLRTSSTSAMSPYDCMYDAIGRRLSVGEAGDSRESVEVSARAVLLADQQVADR